ncbi:MAG: desulfoferrodoxin [Sedimentibacter sp.]|uniref:desulfoferrodoxin n=1 Tax=Sedimentibacter sp. TaxID=1960295 RepID=UPI002981AFAF|nr:desulfoferrodoxin [Sedimentibacter sp.]MDW5299514.1 desulfoferrodoxin [Sedimentibacter sp.]
MCNERKFYICKTCGNLVELINDGGGKLVCCGKEMKELFPNTVDAATEKHVPVIEIEGNKVTVKVGSVAHPMLPEHFIQWIYLVTKNTVQRKCLDPGEQPVAVFALAEGDEVVEAYEYCNLHGLWKKEV